MCKIISASIFSSCCTVQLYCLTPSPEKLFHSTHLILFDAVMWLIMAKPQSVTGVVYLCGLLWGGSGICV